MRKFHVKRGMSFQPSVNIDRLWSLVPEEVYTAAKSSPESGAPVVDVTKLVSAERISSCDNISPIL
jgi:large subunit ribosomal protein L27Ae